MADLLDVIAAKESENAAGGTGDSQPPPSNSPQGDGNAAPDGSEPWHKDPRFQKFLQDKKELDSRLAALRESEGRASPAPERGIEDMLPPEQPLPTPEELAKLGIEKDQYDGLRKMAEAIVNNDRRAMLKGFLESKKKQEVASQSVAREEINFLKEAEEDFGSLGFGSLKDPNSPLWKRADVIRRSDRSLQTPQGVYRAARKALQELVKENPSRTTDRGESLISGSQPTGTFRGGGKRLSEAEYFKLDRKAQEEYDRRSLGLPPA